MSLRPCCNDCRTYRTVVTLVCCFLIPGRCLGRVLIYTLAIGANDLQVELCIDMTLVRSLAIPAACSVAGQERLVSWTLINDPVDVCLYLGHQAMQLLVTEVIDERVITTWFQTLSEQHSRP